MSSCRHVSPGWGGVNRAAAYLLGRWPVSWRSSPTSVPTGWCYQGDPTPIGRYETLGETETQARSFAREFGIDTIVVHERDGEVRVQHVEPEHPAPTPRDVKGPAAF